MIYGEVLQGVVDGFNNTFTSQHTISTVQDLFLGGLSVSPTLYTSSGRKIVFTTAPILGAGSITLDYFEGDDYPKSATSDELTVLEIVNNIYTSIGRGSTSTIFPKATILKSINDCYLKNINSLKHNSLYSAYSFSKSGNIESNDFYRGDLIKINGIIDNYFPRTGKLLIGESIVDYTTRTDTAFTLSDGQTFQHYKGMQIIAGYKLPTDVKDVVKVIIDGYEINSIRPEEVTKYSYLNKLFFIKDGYIFILGEYSQVSTFNIPVVRIHYKKVNSIFVLDGDIIPIPYEYTAVLEDYATYKILQDREDDRWQGIQMRYKEGLREYRAYLNRQSKPEHKITFSGPLSVI